MASIFPDLSTLSVEISAGEDDDHQGLKLGVDGEPFWRVHITPTGEILVGNGMSLPTSFTGGAVSDAAYGVGWNGDTTTAPSKNSVYDKIESLILGGAVDVLSNVAQDRLIGRITTGSGDSEELTAAQVRTLLNIEDGATADQTAAEILAALLTVDGAGSGLDADLLDGISSAGFATATGLSDHLTDVADAHDASAISVLDTAGAYTGNDVEAVLAELPGTYAPLVHAGSLIGLTNYGPGTALSVSTTSTSFADVDATNLAVSFTVPASGNVLVKLQAGASVSSSTEMSWGLRESTTNLNDGIVCYSGAGSLEVQGHISFYVTGLTPGASKTYKFAHARVFGSGSCVTRCGGGSGTNGPAVMEVWAAP